MYVLVVAISGGDVVATSVVAKSAPSSDSRVIVSHVFICRDERELLAALTCLE